MKINNEILLVSNLKVWMKNYTNYNASLTGFQTFLLPDDQKLYW